MKGACALQTISSTAMAVAMICAFVLVAGGIKLSLSKATRSRGVLMMVAALVLFANVLIWTL